MNRSSFKNKFARKRGKHSGSGSRDRPEKRFIDAVKWKHGREKKDNQGPAALSELKEEQVYITEYVSANKGFRGILKSRISDFQVNEIDPEGNECVLTDLSLPVAPKEETNDNDIREQLAVLIPAETLERMKNLADTKEQCKDTIELEVTDLTKEDRGKIHNGVKALYGQSLVGNTVSKNDKKFIIFTKYSNAVRQDHRQKWVWPEPVLHFVLYKENIDTIQAINQLSDGARQKASLFAYAGTKDRRGKTSQWISISKCDPKKIEGVARKTNTFKVGNFCFKPEGLKLGDLSGNRFRIALRHVDADDSVIQESMERFKENGFINYFGLQRFGNCVTIPTYQIGIAILKGDWQGACDLILKPRDGDFWYMKEMREEWACSKNAEQALAALVKPDKTIERIILSHLTERPKDFMGAITSIPRNMRSLYLHSYQSFIWNQMVSRRIKAFGYKLIPGDLVMVDKSVKTEETCIEDVELEKCDDQETEPNPQQEDKTESYYKKMVRPLTETDIESGEYSMFDLVMPLPGHDITYPSNVVAHWYEEALAEDNLSSEKFKWSSRKDAVTGAYRKVIVKPSQLSWKIVNYSKHDDPLILSDLEKLQKVAEPNYEGDTPYKALMLNFILPPSCYATMAIREINRQDTSAKHQRDLEKGVRLPASVGGKQCSDAAENEEETTIKKAKLD
ncbi:pseudouridylate synthase 7 homolog [Uranotaenia lowii]|uniref:pseudouridylate synthase 7 homolog n=1 Tax=Uranotaenia lowii TaxID=190385 RepID=UPI002479F419|nr:pseudouridylate synthase 7 homolog [Uranotaenia lowii]